MINQPLTLTCDSGYTVQGAPDRMTCDGIGTESCTIQRCLQNAAYVFRTHLTYGELFYIQKYLLCSTSVNVVGVAVNVVVGIVRVCGQLVMKMS